MLKIDYDCVEAVNEMVNRPDIFEHHLVTPGREEPLDLSPMFERGGFAVIDDRASFLFDPLTNWAHEVHVTVLHPYRKQSRQLAKEAAQIYFEDPGHDVILARFKDNKPAKMLALWTGFRHIGDVDGYQIMKLNRDMWRKTLN